MYGTVYLYSVFFDFTQYVCVCCHVTCEGTERSGDRTGAHATGAARRDPAEARREPAPRAPARCGRPVSSRTGTRGVRLRGSPGAHRTCGAAPLVALPLGRARCAARCATAPQQGPRARRLARGSVFFMAPLAGRNPGELSSTLATTRLHMYSVCTVRCNNLEFAVPLVAGSRQLTRSWNGSWLLRGKPVRTRTASWAQSAKRSYWVFRHRRRSAPDASPRTPKVVRADVICGTSEPCSCCWRLEVLVAAPAWRRWVDG